MGSGCEGSCAAEALREKQHGTLIKVLWINALMFLAVIIAALYARSSALLSDSLDYLGDALTYGLSLYAVTGTAHTKAKVALFKGALILMAALLVVSQIIYRVIIPVIPSYEIMSIFSITGLLANGLCVWLLWRHRKEDINMSSVFECSRNDIAANLSVIIAAIGVAVFNAGWPDIVIASLLALLLLRSSMRVISGALAELKAPGKTV